MKLPYPRQRHGNAKENQRGREDNGTQSGAMQLTQIVGAGSEWGNHARRKTKAKHDLAAERPERVRARFRLHCAYYTKKHNI